MITLDTQLKKLREDLNKDWSTKYVKANDDLGYIKMSWTITSCVMNSDNYDGDYFSPWSSVESIVNDYYLDILSQNKNMDPIARRIESLMILHENVITYLYKKMNKQKVGDFKDYLYEHQL